METTVAAPAASATTAAAAAPSTSTASTTTATAAPTTGAATDTAATSTATTTAATTDTAATLTPNAGESDASFLARVMNAKNGVEGTADDAADDDVDDDTDDAGEDGQQDEPKTEEKTDEQTTDDAGDDDAYDPYVPQLGPLPPTELNKKISDNPALKAALDADPELKNSLFATSRLASETAGFKEVFANPELAKIAAAGNREFSTLSDLVTSIEKPEDAQGFYGKLMELSVLQDDDGNPIIDQASGKPVSDGTVGRLIHHTGALFLNHFEQLAKADGKEDPELAAAVDILKARAFGRGTASTNEDLTEEQQAKAQELETRENTLRETEQKAQHTRIAEFEQGIVTGIDKVADGEIGTLLGRTDVAENDRGDMTAKLRQAAYDLVAANPEFHREQDVLMRRSMGPKTSDARIGLGRKWFNIALPLVAAKILAENGVKVMARQAQKQKTQDARVEASRSESAGSLRTSKPAQLNPTQVSETAISTLTAKLGRNPKTEEILAEVMRMKSAG